MSSPFSEPTKLVQIFGSYKSQVRSSMGGRSESFSDRVAEKRPLNTRLTFDESFSDVFSEPKIPKLNRDPFDSITGRKRFCGSDTEAVAQLEADNQKLREKLKHLTAENAGELAKNTRLENRLQTGELTHKKERVEFEQKLEKATRLYKLEVDKNSDLTHKIKRSQDRQYDKEERVAENRRESLDRTDVLERKVGTLRDSRNKLQDKVERLESQLHSRPDVDTFTYRNQIQSFESEISELKFGRSELEEKNRALQTKVDAQAPTVAASVQTKGELMRCLNKVEELQCELETLRDAGIQRKVMQEKLDRFGQIERENSSLRNRNDLLLQTQTSTGLLNEQLASVIAERDRAEKRVKDRDTIRAELEIVRTDLKSWLELMVGVATTEQRRLLAVSGLQAAKEILHGFQTRELELVSVNVTLKNEVADLENKLENGLVKYRNLEAALNKVKGEQSEQARLIKKLQRKLLLVTKERDSNRGILDSVEKEMTLSGNQWEQEKICGLEKTLEEYKAMIDMLLEREEGDEMPVMKVSEQEKVKQHDEFQQLQNTYSQLLEKYERLEMELESRAIKGDYNPDSTKVLHFTRNPMSQAVERLQTDTNELQSENDALKARVKLLEEGQTKDITMMVGHRLEEGASSAEVLELNKQLESSNTKNQRIMDAFKQTSKDFREFVAETTGFKIEKRGQDTYKMKSVYAESASDYLLFLKTAESGVELLESDYMAELQDLLKLHIYKSNSIPMFLAGLTTELFRQKQVEDEEEEEDDEDEDEDEGEEDEAQQAQYEGEEEEGEMVEGDDQDDEVRSQDSEERGSSSDVIMVDSD